MKAQGKRVCVLFLALVFFSGILGSQSKETGAIEGIVVDDLKNLLPGVEIKLSSPHMIGGTRSKLTDSSGKYRFVGLQPGTYAIEASLQGFTTERREGVRLFSGQSLNVDFALQIGKLEQEVVVKAVAPLIDVKDSGIVAANIDSKTMSNIIFARGEKPYYTFDVVSLAPGVEGTEAYGTRARVDNVYQIDGVDTSTPSSGSDWMEPDIEIFEEAHVVGLGPRLNMMATRALI